MVRQDIFQEFYNDPAVVGHYKETGRLNPAEIALLSRVKDELKGQPILDIGIGGGRTTPYLQEISASYTGIDFSASMIQSARQRFPGASLLVCDARDLSIFRSSQFVAVFFIGAGIDDISATDRLLVFKEIDRVLRRPGMFILSTHNLDAPYVGFGSDSLRLSRNPAVLIRDNLIRLHSRISHVSRRLWNGMHDKGHVVCMDYDECFGSSGKLGALLPTYYIGRDAQVRQLLESGFDVVEATDQNGNVVDDGKRVRDQFLYYIARKDNSRPANERAAKPR